MNELRFVFVAVMLVFGKEAEHGEDGQDGPRRGWQAGSTLRVDR